ncbi:GerMN domain-containing protein [Faecalicatena contorta]|uniref:GerMN domain-containing protein n=1 Tax=Faecalicatena contorta TaxID=39482 RepID=UPI001F3C9D2D|nr:GerMN domain-containing protein [Faecalicatena contorta]MCF2682954.1 GerMN domain-containing protein [Faecalicatena contorta]
MSKKRRYQIVLSAVLCMIMVTGCGRGKQLSDSDQGLYYANQEGTALVKEEYKAAGSTTEEKIEDVLKEMPKKTDDEDYRSVFPEGVKVTGWEYADGKLEICFNGQYQEMTPSQEVLLRAAVVQNLGQIQGVNYVYFLIEGEPLKDSQGSDVGYMRAEDFIQNTGSTLHSYQSAELDLYFPNSQGDKLVKESVSIRYNSNMSKEKLIVEQLIKGPLEEGAQLAIPPETKVMSVSVKDHICYVNLDEGFLNNSYLINPELTVYSIVNSIVDGGSSSKVQISVNGKSDINYMGRVDLSKPLSRNPELVE